MKTAEEVVLALSDLSSPLSTLPMRSKAFSWATNKKFDQKVSADFRKRASTVARVIWNDASKRTEILSLIGNN